MDKSHKPEPGYRENDNMKEGRPPRAATEPEGAEGSAKTPKTRTDPASGVPH